MTARRHFLGLAFASVLLAAAPFAFAAPQPAQDFVKEKTEKLMKALRDGKSDAEVDKVFDEILDYSVLAEASLRDHWDECKGAERDEFIKLLTKLVRTSYRKNLKKTLGYEIQYTGTEAAKEGGDVVHTKALNKKDARQEPYSIDYVVRSVGSAQRIVDVVTEGSSMVGNYRTSFNKIIKKGGIPEVLKRMRKRAETGGSGPD